ncbi:Polynucleotide adenylyltransferase family protein [Balamuthia mandrillaris]
MEPRPSTPAAAVAVVLTEAERQIFDFLLEVVAHYQLGTTLRAAGGWVRDKIRGNESDDIDIALDNMMGSPFATLVNEYLQQKGYETHSIGVIHSNPEQSKHLETATMRIFDVWIDLVNLRSESYAADSRIPDHTQIGTPKEDALRRDLTINSLFYNINTASIEDWTGTGLKDLAEGIIRTPLSPHTTFLDDPLRVLRAVRFASRLGFVLDDELVAAAMDTEIQTALSQKVSRERIGNEVEGMLNGRNPDSAFDYILQLGLFDIVWNLPPKTDFSHQSDSREHCTAQLHRMKRLLDVASSSISIDPARRRLLLLSSFFKLFAGHSYANKKGRATPVIEYLVIESVKWKIKDAKDIITVAENAEKLRAFAASLASTNSFNRQSVGLVLRETKQLWEDALLVGLSQGLPFSPSEEEHHQQQILALYRLFQSKVLEEGLDQVWKLAPLWNGKELAEALGLAPGPRIGQLIQREIEWQLAHPSASKEECLLYLRKEVSS